MEIPQSLIDARNAIERKALRLRNSISELENTERMLSRFIRLAAAPAGCGTVVGAELVEAKASLERLAVRLAADADLGEPVALLQGAVDEIDAGYRAAMAAIAAR